MSAGHYNILFLSNDNTARSIFAEAVTNRLGQQRFKGFSAGISPARNIDPLVLDILRVAQYPTDELRPKHWKEVASAEHLIQAIILLLLLFDVLPYHRFVSTYGRD